MTLSRYCEPAADDQSLELVVDLSNVCREKRLDGLPDVARWERLLLVLATWNTTFSHFQKPKVRLVQDANLRHLFSPLDKKYLNDAKRQGFLIEKSKADPTILDLAESSDALILSNDNFVAFHRGRPWITSADRKRFVKMAFFDEKLSLAMGVIESRTNYRISRMEETDNLRDNKIDPKSKDGLRLLQFYYRCENPDCIRRQLLADGAQHLPAKGGNDQVICPGCRQPMIQLGRSSQVVIIKLTSLSNHEDLRFPVVKDEIIVLGRADSHVPLSNVVDKKGIKKISRSHLKLEFTGNQLLVTDLGSSNGSFYKSWDYGKKCFSEDFRMKSNEARSLGTEDLVTLSGIVEVKRSGRRFPFDLAPPSTSGKLITMDTETQLD